MLRHGQDEATLRGVLEDDLGKRKQAVRIQRGRRLVRVDDKPMRSLAAYAVLSPVVSFHPGELELTMGAAAMRRRLLDRVTAYAQPTSMAELDAYTRALKERQRALEERGAEARDLDAWEELLVKHGLAIAGARQATLDALAPHAERALARIVGKQGHRVALRYAATAPANEGAYASELAASRERDAHRGSASLGPHRDDLLVMFDEREARAHASQGQHRALTLALKAAEMEFLSARLGKRPILLLDDVSSELDRERTSALFSLLTEQHGQVFLTTTRPELIATETLAERRDFRVISGRIES
jgi:DNA replication and repair protein RecF